MLCRSVGGIACIPLRSFAVHTAATHLLPPASAWLPTSTPGAPLCPLVQIKAQEDVLRQQLADLRAKEAEQGSDIPALIQERDECRCAGSGWLACSG